MIIGSTPEKGSKSRKLSDPNKPIIYSGAGLSREYEIYAAEQQNLENLRYVNYFKNLNKLDIFLKLGFQNFSSGHVLAFFTRIISWSFSISSI